MKKFTDYFLDHPKEVNETYWGHFAFAIKGAWFLIKTGFVLCIHAILPFLFTTYASERITAFAEKFMKRNLSCHVEPEQP